MLSQIFKVMCIVGFAFYVMVRVAHLFGAITAEQAVKDQGELAVITTMYGVLSILTRKDGR